MQYSENYNFNLPDGTDKVNIENINKNFSDIDGYLAENTARLDELEENGGVGGGVTPALYVRTASSETVEGITWHIEKYNNGYARCWGELSKTITINSMLLGVYSAWIDINLPTSLFTRVPEYASVTINTGAKGFCVVNVADLGKDTLSITVNRIDEEPTTKMSDVRLYIEVRGDCSLG